MHRRIVRIVLAVLALAACGHVAAADAAASNGVSHPTQAVTESAPITPATKTEFLDAYKHYQQLVADGKRKEALPYAATAYRLGLQLYGEDHANSAALALNYGDTLARTGHRKEAIEMLDRAIDLYKKHYGADAKEMVDPIMARAEANGAWNPDEQRKYFDEAIDIAEHTSKPEDLLVAHLNVEAGIHLLRDGNVDTSKDYLDDGYKQYKKQVAATDSRLLIAAFWLGKYELAVNKPHAAEPHFNEVLAATNGTSTDPLTEAAHALLVVTYEELGESEKATPHCIAVARVQPWNGNTEPKALYSKMPDYPADAKGRDGYALIEFTIDATGAVRNPKLLKTEGSDAFGAPGLSAIQSWRYAPRLVDGKPVDTTGVKTKVEFKLTP